MKDKKGLGFKLFGDMFTDMPLFFKLWMGLCFGGALLIMLFVIGAFIVALTDDRSGAYRAGQTLGEIEQGYKDAANAP